MNVQFELVLSAALEHFSAEQLEILDRRSLENFAKHLIKDCANVARQWEDEYVVEDTAVYHVDYEVERHFGVSL